MSVPALWVWCALPGEADLFLDKYDAHLAGSSEHREYWIPAADLEEFNQNIVGAIEVIAEFRGRG